MAIVGMGCQAMRACHKNRDGNWSPIFNLCRQVPISSAFVRSAAIKTGSSSRITCGVWCDSATETVLMPTRFRSVLYFRWEMGT